MGHTIPVEGVQFVLVVLVPLFLQIHLILPDLQMFLRDLQSAQLLVLVARTARLQLVLRLVF